MSVCVRTRRVYKCSPRVCVCVFVVCVWGGGNVFARGFGVRRWVGSDGVAGWRVRRLVHPHIDQAKLREAEVKRGLEALRKEKAALLKQLDDALLQLNQNKSAMQVCGGGGVWGGEGLRREDDSEGVMHADLRMRGATYVIADSERKTWVVGRFGPGGRGGRGHRTEPYMQLQQG